VDDPSPQEPPARVHDGLEEALDLLAAPEAALMPSSRATTWPWPLRWSIKSSCSAVHWALMNPGGQDG
jgi:hypothetical protein